VGDGSFGPGVRILLPAYIIGNIATADFDGSGTLDIAVPGLKGVMILLGLGGGAFEHPAAFPANGSAGAALAADLNSDGAPDLVMIGGDLVTVLLNTSNGAWAGRRF